MQQLEWGCGLAPHLCGCQQLGKLKTSLSPAAGGMHLVDMNVYIFLLIDLHPAEPEKGTGLGHLRHLCLRISVCFTLCYF